MSPAAAPFTTSLLFAGSFIAARAVTLEFQPLTATLLRYLIALLFLAVLGVMRSYSFRISRSDVPRLALLGVFGIVGYHYFFFLAIRQTAVVNTAIINGLSPVVTAVLAAVLIRERLSRVNYVGVASAVAGVTVLLSRADLATLRTLAFNRGELLMLVAVSSWAGYALLIKGLSQRYSAFCLAFYASAFGIVLLIPLASTEGPIAQLGAASPAALAALAYMGVAASGMGYVLYNIGVRRVGPTRTAALVYGLVPVWTAILALLFYGEALTAITVASVLLIIAGVYYTLTTPRPRDQTPGLS